MSSPFLINPTQTTLKAISSLSLLIIVKSTLIMSLKILFVIGSCGALIDEKKDQLLFTSNSFMIRGSKEKVEYL